MLRIAHAHAAAAIASFQRVLQICLSIKIGGLDFNPFINLSNES